MTVAAPTCTEAGLLSTLAMLPATPLWNEANLMAELAWNRVLRVTDNAAAVDPHATRDAVSLRMQLEPSYRQVLPGLDLGVLLALATHRAGRARWPWAQALNRQKVVVMSAWA